jgi:hypothetical protein
LARRVTRRLARYFNPRQITTNPSALCKAELREVLAAKIHRCQRGDRKNQESYAFSMFKPKPRAAERRRSLY